MVNKCMVNQPNTLPELKCSICGGILAVGETGIFDTRFGIKAEYSLRHCRVCGLETTVPAPRQNDLRQLYEDFYNFSGQKTSGYTALRESFMFSAIYRFWLAIDGDISFHLQKGSGRLLDVGCNEGRGLEFYKRNGFEVEGLELNQVAAEAARARGFTVYTDEIESLKADDAYDVVVLSNVLEHSLDPKDMLLQVKRLLKPGGRIWISCPNNRSWLRVLFGRYWINWHVPFHLWHFSAVSLTRLLDEVGFSDIRITNKTPTLWVAQSVIARLFARPGRPTRQLRFPLLVGSLTLIIRSLCFPILWLGNRLGKGDCLVVTANDDSEVRVNRDQ